MPSPSEWSQVPPHLQTELKFTPAATTHNTVPRMYFYYAGDVLPFAEMREQIADALLRTTPINRGAWQTLNVSESVQHDTHELRNVHVIYDVPGTATELIEQVSPDLPWAEAHFGERVFGEPMNPAPSYKYWPHHTGSAERHVDGTVFSHTYPERFWPKLAGLPKGPYEYTSGNRGIRFEYGDLDGLVSQLAANPLTRQAVLPVWFPEDTGATDRRVPCSLFYHFQSDGDGRLDCWYSMRACDFARHFHNDVYLAGRLLQWVCGQLAYREGPDDAIVREKSLMPGHLNMTISNLHLFRGDAEKMT